MLEASVDDIEFTNGRFQVRGTDRSTGIGDVAMAAFAAHDTPEGIEPGLDAEATFDPEGFSYPHGTHLCALEFDTETGGVTMRKYVAVDDPSG
jgi:carbon-monoxide dehydrogenase large subunit